MTLSIRRLSVLLVPLTLVFAGTGLRAQESGKPELHEVQAGEFVVPLTLEAIFESTHMEEVAVQTEVWSDLEVVRAVEPGARVDRDEVIIELSTEEIDRAIADLEHSLHLARINLQTAEIGVRILEQTVPLDLEATRRASEDADESLVRFLKRGKDLREKSEKVSLKAIEDSLAYQMEELRQLEKMYKADDLTEETEEIVLQRQRDVVERLKFSVEAAREDHRVAFEVSIPRREQMLKDVARRRELTLNKARIQLPASLETGKLGLEQQKIELERMEEKLGKLRADREKLEVRAPRSGVVYYGQCRNGEWENGSSSARSLRRGGNLQPRQVVLTVVDPDRLRLRATLSASQLSLLEKGQKGHVQVPAWPTDPLEVKVSHVDRFPATGSGYGAIIELKGSRDDVRPVPGMNGQLLFTGYREKKAITVPLSALIPDPVSPVKARVMVQTDDGAEPVTVRLGRRNEKVVEILDGLDSGVKIHVNPSS